MREKKNIPTLLVTAVLILSAFMDIRAQQNTIPHSFIEDIFRQAGTWVADNSSYKNANEPVDLYVIEWTLSPLKNSLYGRLYGMKDNREIGTYWDFHKYWDPVQKKIILMQIGRDGTIGTGPIIQSQRESKLIQLFTKPDGNKWKEGHKTKIQGEDSEVMSSFTIDDHGTWVPQRTYTWNKINNHEGTESSEKPEYVIAYNVLLDKENDNYEVFTMNMDGTGKKNLTNLPGVEWTYIAYRDNLFFISDKDSCHRCGYRLYKTNYKGDNPKKISDLRLADSWMSTRKNGAEIIVTPNRKVDSAFYIINPDGGIVKRIETGLPYSTDPLFVNDGRQIVFRGGLTKSKLIEGFDEALYIMDTDGKNRKRLTCYPENDTTAGRFDYRAGTPKLHPSEEYITYQSKQDGKYSLYAVSLDGRKTWKLTNNEENEGWHDWSPDGKWLAIELFDNDQTQFHIGLMNWETKKMKILTDTTYQYQQCPVFVLKN